jgi:hypothetical protein
MLTRTRKDKTVFFKAASQLTVIAPALLCLFSCNSSQKSSVPTQPAVQAQATERSVLPPLHAPTSSILKDPRLHWSLRPQSALIGSGYDAESIDFATRYLCFDRSKEVTQENLSESGYRLVARRDRDGQFAIYLFAVHITRMTTLPELVWDQNSISFLTAPKNQQGLGLSLEEVAHDCSYGTVSSISGHIAYMNFYPQLRPQDETPAEVDLFFENTPEGISALIEAYEPYKEFEKTTTGAWNASFMLMPGASQQLTEEQKTDPSQVLSVYLNAVIKKTETSAKLREGEDLDGYLKHVEKAPRFRRWSWANVRK